ncbi:prepilin-type N-terminal cleavage/methylation domain-containing protein (plasmid) [Comamonas aquatica]|nr:prepilin-type N-terminal cleavage/methylation domain-containing protein [Comamonas aquatica]
MRKQQKGFTLIEVMVATSIMAVMGAMSWLGIDAMLTTKERTFDKSTQTSALQIGLSQWATDLDNAYFSQSIEPMGWDGKAFRLTRRSEQADKGVVVVAWATRTDGQLHQLMRWRSEPVLTQSQWNSAWQQAAVWARGGQIGSPAVLFPAESMNVHFFANNVWTNAQSTASDKEVEADQESAVLPTSKKKSTQPSGVRLQLTTPNGTLTKDWVSPLHSGTKS